MLPQNIRAINILSPQCAAVRAITKKLSLEEGSQDAIKCSLCERFFLRLDFWSDRAEGLCLCDGSPLRFTAMPASPEYFNHADRFVALRCIRSRCHTPQQSHYHKFRCEMLVNDDVVIFCNRKEAADKRNLSCVPHTLVIIRVWKDLWGYFLLLIAQSSCVGAAAQTEGQSFALRNCFATLCRRSDYFQWSRSVLFRFACEWSREQITAFRSSDWWVGPRYRNGSIESNTFSAENESIFSQYSQFDMNNRPENWCAKVKGLPWAMRCR